MTSTWSGADDGARSSTDAAPSSPSPVAPPWPDPWPLEPPGTGFRDDLDADAARKGVTLLAQAEVDGMRLLASLAYQGYGAAVLPASAVIKADDDNWRVVPLTGTTPRAVGLATPRRGRLSAPARITLDTIRAVALADVPSRRGLRLPAIG